jgi:hypothetical protein
VREGKLGRPSISSKGRLEEELSPSTSRANVEESERLSSGGGYSKPSPVLLLWKAGEASDDGEPGACEERGENGAKGEEAVDRGNAKDPMVCCGGGTKKGDEVLVSPSVSNSAMVGRW